MAAPKGNKNATKGKRWQDALVKALAQYEDKKSNILRGHALAKVAEMVVLKALAGDKDAIQEIGNRLDGKPAQALEHSGPDGEPIHVFERRFVGTGHNPS